MKIPVCKVCGIEIPDGELCKYHQITVPLYRELQDEISKEVAREDTRS